MRSTTRSFDSSINGNESNKNVVKNRKENDIQTKRNKIDELGTNDYDLTKQVNSLISNISNGSVGYLEANRIYATAIADGLRYHSSNYGNYVTLNQTLTKQIASEQLINSFISRPNSKDNQQNVTNLSSVERSNSHDATSVESRFSHMTTAPQFLTNNLQGIPTNESHHTSQSLLNASSNASMNTANMGSMRGMIAPPNGNDFHPSGKAHVESKFKSRFKGGKLATDR